MFFPFAKYPPFPLFNVGINYNRTVQCTNTYVLANIAQGAGGEKKKGKK